MPAGLYIKLDLMPRQEVMTSQGTCLSEDIKEGRVRVRKGALVRPSRGHSPPLCPQIWAPWPLAPGKASCASSQGHPQRPRIHLQIVLMILPYVNLVPYREARAVTADFATRSWRKCQARPPVMASSSQSSKARVAWGLAGDPGACTPQK